MKQYFRIFQEGAAQAWSQLLSNKLRTFLSLLGVTIGIFCIIGVKSAVDSLEANIRNSMKKLGDDVLYVEKFSWGEDPGENFWKWMRRPNISYEEFERLRESVPSADKMAFWLFVGNKPIKWQSSSIENAFCIAATYDMEEMFRLEFENGRFFTPTEYETAVADCVLGHVISDGLFGAGIDPIGKTISWGGRKLRVIGTLKASGKDLLKPFNFDEAVLIGYNLARRIANVRPTGMWSRTSMCLKAKPGVDLEVLKDEVTASLRAHRRIRPREENSFALNTLSIISGLFDKLFGVLNVVGFLIGGFALVVGMFSVANIMFVSVKERTSIIGIKKALGAKRWVILLEFLIESVVLCLIGGLFGLILIFIVVTVISKALDFEMALSPANMFWGVFASVFVGVLSGVLPAAQASALDPVEAMRK